MKRLIRLEKRLRKAAIKALREQAGTRCKLFWVDLKGKYTMSNSESERRRWGGSREEEGYIGGFGHALGRSGEGIPVRGGCSN